MATLLVAVAAGATVAAIQYRLVASKRSGSGMRPRTGRKRKPRPRRSWKPASTSTASPWPTASCRADNLGRAQELLDECPPGLRQWEWYYLKRLCRLDPVILRDKAEVNSVAFSPDGERLASAGGDGTVKVWNSRTGEVVQTLDANTDFVYSVAFHPDGKHLAAAGADRKVRVWDLTTGKAVFDLPRVRRYLLWDGVRRGVQPRRPAPRGGE